MQSKSCTDQRLAHAASCLGGSGPSEGARVGLGRDCKRVGDDWRVVGEGEAVAGADLQHRAGQAGMQGAVVVNAAWGSMAGLAGQRRERSPGVACCSMAVSGLAMPSPSFSWLTCRRGTILPLVQVVK